MKAGAVSSPSQKCEVEARSSMGVMQCEKRGGQPGNELVACSGIFAGRGLLKATILIREICMGWIAAILPRDLHL